MRAKRVTRYYADCGKGYWNKQSCLYHEENCKCWKNPKFKTCLSCKFKNMVEDSNGMENEPNLLQTWVNNCCLNPKMDFDKHFTPAHKNAPVLCINCPMWEAKTK